MVSVGWSVSYSRLRLIQSLATENCMLSVNIYEFDLMQGERVMWGQEKHVDRLGVLENVRSFISKEVWDISVPAH